MDKPIEVNPSPVPASLATLLRYALTAIGTLMATKGLLPIDADIEQIVGMAIAVISAGYGIYKTVFNKKQLVTAAEAAPNSVAVVTK